MTDYTHLSSINVQGTVSSKAQGVLVGSFSTLPTASAEYAGKTVLYTGADTESLKGGSFYTATETDGVYEWTAVDITSIPVDTQLSDQSGNAIANDVVTNALAGKQAVGDYATNTALENGLATKQGTLSSTQMDAVNSGIDTSKVAAYDAYASTKMNVADFYTVTGGTPYSSTNPLTTQDFVNSSIATNTANFIGTYNVVTDLSLTTSATTAQVASALNTYMSTHSISPTNNDYAFVYYDYSTDPGNIDKYERYKYVAGTTPTWAYEYTLNNSSFTDEQWKAINSGVSDQSSVGGYATVQGTQALTNKSVNGVTPATQSTGFTISGGTTSKTLTVNQNYTLGAACAMDVATSVLNETTSVPRSDAVYSAINTCAKLDGGTSTSLQTFTGYNKFTNSTFTELSITNEHQIPYAFTNTNLATKTTIPSSTMNFYMGLIGNTDRQAISTFTTQIAPTSRISKLLLVSQRGYLLDFGLVSSATEDHAVAPYRTTGLGNSDIITKGNLEDSNHTFTGVNKFTKYIDGVARKTIEIPAIDQTQINNGTIFYKVSGFHRGASKTILEGYSRNDYVKIQLGIGGGSGSEAVDSKNTFARTNAKRRIFFGRDANDVYLFISGISSGSNTPMSGSPMVVSYMADNYMSMSSEVYHDLVVDTTTPVTLAYIQGLTYYSEITDSNYNSVDNTFTGINTVPKPANTTAYTSGQIASVAYVNDPTDGVNNIVHKSGNEIVTGEKIFNLPYVNNQYWTNYGNLDLDKFNLPSTDPDYISSVQIPWNLIKLTKGDTLNSHFIGYSQVQLLHSNITYADSTTEVCNKVMYRQTIRGAKPDSTFTNQGATMDFETIWSTKYNKKIDFIKATYRTNTSEIPYDNYEVVTIGMLKHLGLIS